MAAPKSLAVIIVDQDLGFTEPVKLVDFDDILIALDHSLIIDLSGNIVTKS